MWILFYLHTMFLSAFLHARCVRAVPTVVFPAHTRTDQKKVAYKYAVWDRPSFPRAASMRDSHTRSAPSRPTSPRIVSALRVPSPCPSRAERETKELSGRRLRETPTRALPRPGKTPLSSQFRCLPRFEDTPTPRRPPSEGRPKLPGTSRELPPHRGVPL